METNKLASATEQLSQLKAEGIKFAADKGPALIGAIVILVAGFILARTVCRLLGKWLERRQLDPPVCMLLTRVTWLVIMALFFMVALGTLGIAVGPLIALMSVAGVGVGLAMQGVLGNLVSGLLIIFTAAVYPFGRIDMIGHALIMMIIIAIAVDHTRELHFMTAIRRNIVLLPVSLAGFLAVFVVSYWGLHMAIYGAGVPADPNAPLSTHSQDPEKPHPTAEEKP